MWTRHMFRILNFMTVLMLIADNFLNFGRAKTEKKTEKILISCEPVEKSPP